MRFKYLAASFAVVLIAVLTACGGNDHSGHAPKKQDTFNNQDVKFAQQMIPHHLQATEMAALAKDRTKNQDVLDLAADIERAQGPEIDTMSTWLDAWGKEMPGGHHSMEDMGEDEGMMSGSQMTELAESKGTAFDRRFLSMMIEHHEGAIAMAKSEQAKGKNADAISLAKKIQEDQSREITLMKSLLNN